MNSSKRIDGEPSANHPSPPAVARTNRLLSRCSLNCLRRLARPVAWLARHSDNQLRRAVRDNLRLAFPDLDDKARAELARQALFHTAAAFTETAFIWHRPIGQVLALADESGVCQQFVDDSGPRIVVAPHHGNWEYLNLWLADRLPLLSLYKPARKPGLDRYIRDSRTRNGARLLPTSTSGLRGLIRGLRQGESCMILPDQKPGRGRGQVEAPFFGLMVDTSTLVQQLAARTDCSIYMAAALRDEDHGRFRVIVRPLSRERLIQQEPDAAIYLNRSIEELVRECPEQYQWAYRRFRKQDYAQLKVQASG